MPWSAHFPEEASVEEVGVGSAATVEHPALGSKGPIRFYYGWVNVLMASLAMTATLPGRTHGLGLIATPLTADLDISTATFSIFNFWAVLLGSAACLPVGRAIDRFGTRVVGAIVMASLAAAVVGMANFHQPMTMFAILVCVRGLGQGALSVVSLAIVGKWFTRRPGPAMALFAVLLTIGFGVCFIMIPPAVAESGWRVVWRNVGYLILGAAVLNLLFVRSVPHNERVPGNVESDSDRDVNLATALRSPAFWIVSLACAFFNMVSSATSLHNQDLLAAHGYDVKVAGAVMAISAGTGLLANFAGGWFLNHWTASRLLALGLAALAVDLALFPMSFAANGPTTIFGYAILLGVAGGIITVVFFAFYSQAFGRTHLGRIQAVAQVLTVFASAIGPVILTQGERCLGSFDPLFAGGAAVATIFGVIAWRTTTPARLPT